MPTKEHENDLDSVLNRLEQRAAKPERDDEASGPESHVPKTLPRDTGPEKGLEHRRYERAHPRVSYSLIDEIIHLRRNVGGPVPTFPRRQSGPLRVRSMQRPR